MTNQANSATRIRVLFSNVPAGVTPYVPVTLTAPGTRIYDTDSDGVGNRRLFTPDRLDSQQFAGAAPRFGYNLRRKR